MIYDSLSQESNFKGFIKITAFNPKTGDFKTLIDKPNTVVYSGADLLAKALAGSSYSAITNMYVGFNNDAGFPTSPTPPTVNKTDTAQTMIEFYTDNVGDGFGGLRLPLSLIPSYLTTSSSYVNNVVVFTTTVVSATAVAGDAFAAGTSQIYEVGLVAAGASSTVASDKLFSRAQFDPITYVANYNLTINWGVRFES